jgi:hypothetical protein
MKSAAASSKLHVCSSFSNEILITPAALSNLFQVNTTFTFSAANVRHVTMLQFFRPTPYNNDKNNKLLNHVNVKIKLVELFSIRLSIIRINTFQQQRQTTDLSKFELISREKYILH